MKTQEEQIFELKSRLSKMTNVFLGIIEQAIECEEPSKKGGFINYKIGFTKKGYLE